MQPACRNPGYTTLFSISQNVLPNPSSNRHATRQIQGLLRCLRQLARGKNGLGIANWNLREYRPPRRQSQAGDVRQVEYVIAGQEQSKYYRAAQDRDRSVLVRVAISRRRGGDWG